MTEVRYVSPSGAPGDQLDLHGDRRPVRRRAGIRADVRAGRRPVHRRSDQRHRLHPRRRHGPARRAQDQARPGRSSISARSPTGWRSGTPTVSPTEVDGVRARLGRRRGRCRPGLARHPDVGHRHRPVVAADADRSARRRGEPGQGRAGQCPGEYPGLQGSAIAVGGGQPDRHRHAGGRFRDRHDHGRSTVGDRPRATPNAWPRSRRSTPSRSRSRVPRRRSR